MKSIKHTFVKIFGGTYYDNKNHEIANCYFYAGAIPLWIRQKIHKIWFFSVLLWLNIQILYCEIVIYIKSKLK